MKITITGEHEGRTVTIATWEYTAEVVKDAPIEVEEKLWTAIRQQMTHYIKRVVEE
jgi:uncharacterized membrane protein